jgi:hypothetical protein
VRVINPGQTIGAEPTDVRVVTQVDYDRLRQKLMTQLLDEAYDEMGELLEPTEILLRESLRVEAVPKQSYTRFVSEQADTVGLELGVLVSGLAVDVDNAENVAYVSLSRQIPPEYELVDARFELGEVAEDDIGPGSFTFFVTAHGYAAAALDANAAVSLVRGRPLAETQDLLQAEYRLAEPPQVEVWPEWLGRMPLLPLRIGVEVVPQDQHAG